MKSTIVVAYAAIAAIAAFSIALFPQTVQATNFWNTDCTKCSSTYNVHACQSECKVYDCGETCSNINSNDHWLKDKCQKACPTPAPTPAPTLAPTITVYVPVPVPVLVPCAEVQPASAPAPVPVPAPVCQCNALSFNGQPGGYASAECAVDCAQLLTSSSSGGKGEKGKNLRGFEQWQPAPVIAANTGN